MRMLPMIVALALWAALGAALAIPAQAGSGFSVRIGGSQSSVGVYASTTHRSSVHRVERRGERRVKHRGERHVKRRGERRVKRRGVKRAERHPERRRHHGLQLYPRYYYGGYRRRDRDREPAPVAPKPVPPPEVVAPVEPPPPPDPHGPLRLTLARGVEPAPTPYSLGEALPSNLPHVTLDWRKFDLPEPPSGHIYARVRRDVLLITSVGRVVEKVLPPG